MRQFQDLGHHVMFLIGDFTGMIGDPSGRNATRPPLTPRADRRRTPRPTRRRSSRSSIPSKTEILFNSTWCEQLGAAGMMKLAGTYTVARMLERDDFAKRFAEQRPISIHEFLYPLMQGYDSVAMKADVELGGTDQKFNLLVGRELQKHYGQEPQVIITMPLLEGLDGVEEDVEVARQLRRHRRAAQRDVRQAHVGLGRADVALHRAAVVRVARRRSRSGRRRSSAGGNPRDIKVRFAQEIVDALPRPGGGRGARSRTSSRASATAASPRTCRAGDRGCRAEGAGDRAGAEVCRASARAPPRRCG